MIHVISLFFLPSTFYYTHRPHPFSLMSLIFLCPFPFAGKKQNKQRGCWSVYKERAEGPASWRTNRKWHSGLHLVHRMEIFLLLAKKVLRKAKTPCSRYNSFFFLFFLKFNWRMTLFPAGFSPSVLSEDSCGNILRPEKVTAVAVLKPALLLLLLATLKLRGGAAARRKESAGRCQQ